ncbi:hypothetical protein FQA39_LY05085 [Lamprigera yunnana]|nr:hypothetical protein FQA39_LY05085 [Lamprigera yunnana]
MYKLSFAKCVCFILLVILASFLSCSGFHIDKLTTMADINKINSFTSTRLSSSNFFNRIIAKNNFSSLPTSIRYKRGYLSSSHESPNFLSGNINNSPVRQTRHLRGRSNKNKKFSSKAQASPSETRVPTGRIDTYVFQPIDDENSAISRSQRSPDKNKSQQQQRNKAYHCQRQDVARKAYLANTVVRAKAESMSSNRVHNYSVTFRILERYKLTHLPIDDTLRLTFSSDTKDMNCEIEGRGRPYDLVKAQIQQSKEYYLFLNSHGMHNYTVVGMPVLKKKRNNNKKNRDLEQIRRVVNKNFVPKSIKKPKIKANRTNDFKLGKKLRLICNVKGFPVPYVSWLKDNVHPHRRVRITYKKKRTTLIINSLQVEDGGVYRCVAKGMDGTIAYEDVAVRISNSEKDNGDECKDERYKDNFCLNGGTCVRIMHKEIGCQCPDGFAGERCGEKDVSNHSSMYGHHTFSCKLGLSTTYYC